jgi:quercetin dioxygenase-like cupin family protein
MGCGNVNALGDRSLNFIGAGVYVLQVQLRRGWHVEQHSHKYDHLAVIPSEGRAVLTVEGEERTLTGPCSVVIEAGKSHSVRALTDMIWQCIHRVDANHGEHVEDIQRRLIT